MATQYVWLNVQTGEFTNSWTEKDHEKYGVQNLIDESTRKNGWVLIKYEAVNDPDFYFYNKMKLR